ncbi:hypothetical protein LINPERHAP1_LOCUS10753 [Linum perenne]
MLQGMEDEDEDGVRDTFDRRDGTGQIGIQIYYLSNEPKKTEEFWLVFGGSETKDCWMLVFYEWKTEVGNFNLGVAA